MSRQGQPVWLRPSTWFVIGALARHANGMRRLKQTLAHVDQPTSLSVGDVTEDLTVHVIVPMLREQPHAAATVAWWTSLACVLPFLTVTIVTSAKEEVEIRRLAERIATGGAQPISIRRFPLLTGEQVARLEDARLRCPHGTLTVEQAEQILHEFPTTFEVVDTLLADGTSASARVRHVHYDGVGRKAAQVNYAVTRIRPVGESRRAYVAIYDVDSRPDADLIKRTAIFLNSHSGTGAELAPVVQQSARFITHEVSGNAIVRAVCRGGARAQTLWTLRREIPDFRRYSRATTRLTGRPILDALARGLAQTVGHGLWVRLDVFRRLGALPMFTFLDDLPFGYRLTIEQVPVHVLPFTATADAPEDVQELIAQGRRWFHNYLDYPRCAAVAAREGHGSRAARAIALMVGGYRGAAWLLRSPTIVGCAAVAARRGTSPVLRLAAAATLWLAIAAPVRALAAAEARRLTPGQFGRECLELTIGYLLSSIGPAQAVAGSLLSRGGRAAAPDKTRRRVATPASG